LPFGQPISAQTLSELDATGWELYHVATDFAENHNVAAGKPDIAHGKGAPGRLQLYVDGALAGNAEAPVTTPFMINPGALTCGANPGSAITDDYASPFKFTGTIYDVTVDVSGELIHDLEAELRMHMARQ